MADESNFTNSIRPTKRPRKGKRPAQEESLAQPSAAIGPTGPAVATKPKLRNAIPDEIRQKFTQVGNRYHFKDGALAFTDRGDRITSPSENTEVIKSLVSIAKEREWSDITVAGTERFRRDAWFAARIASLEVRGYEATEYDQARVARALARVEPTTNGDAAREPSNFNGARSIDREIKARKDRLHLGRLIDHGPAPYKHDAKKSTSYFVLLETADGERELWGIDLQRALNESAARPQRGDEIGVRAVRRETVKVWTPDVAADGEIIGETQVEKQRTTWIIESRAFFKARSDVASTLENPRIGRQQGVQRHPELIGTYLQVHAAELAARAIRDPEDQRRFVNLVRGSLADSIRRGEPLTPVRLKEPEPVLAPAKRPAPIEREPSPSR
jgi:putative DNA primase/helicase